MAHALSSSTVVITGASSGIGRAAARAFSREGARLVLAARSQAGLDAVVAECDEAIAVPTDVRDEAAVEALAQAAVDTYGSVDVWVNLAGVMAYGRFEDIPSEVFETVMDTNFLGTVHGSRAALKRFRAQGHGTLINTSSTWGRIVTPDVTPYIASKFAVRGFSEALHSEVRREPGIEVCVLTPQAVDTPIFRRAGNYVGRPVRPTPPILSVDRVADHVVALARKPRREVTVGLLGRALQAVNAIAPALFQRVIPSVFEASNYASGPLPPGPGNVLEPVAGDRRADGGWKRDRPAELTRAFASATLGAVRGLLGR